MIPAGRTPIDAERAARLHGMAVHTARNKRLFTRPGFPAPLTSGKRKPLWDEEQVAAHANGEPVPPIPQMPPHPDDLLDRAESAAEWDVSPATWDAYMSDGYTPPPDRVIGGRELWYRHTLRDYKRPGRASGAGRPLGAKDQRPRTHKPKSARLAEVNEVLARLGPDAPVARVIEQIVQDIGVSRPSAYRLLGEARQEATEPKKAERD
jgi:hypothetical protein